MEHHNLQLQYTDIVTEFIEVSGVLVPLKFLIHFVSGVLVPVNFAIKSSGKPVFFIIIFLVLVCLIPLCILLSVV